MVGNFLGRVNGGAVDEYKIAQHKSDGTQHVIWAKVLIAHIPTLYNDYTNTSMPTG